METEQDDSAALARAWRARDLLFLEMFGPQESTIPRRYEPPIVEIPEVSTAADIAAILSRTISEKQISVLIYPPNELRPYWMYLTSGLSNPWFGGDDNEVSGFGLELMIKTKEKARWPVRLLRRVVYYIVSYSGTLHPGVMLDLDTPLLAKQQEGLGSVLIWYADETPDCVYQLPSGAFGIFLVLGLATDESDFVRSQKHGGWFMQQLLRNTGLGQLTEPGRQSIMSRDDIRPMIGSLINYIQQFGMDTEQTTQQDDEFWVD